MLASGSQTLLWLLLVGGAGLALGWLIAWSSARVEKQRLARENDGLIDKVTVLETGLSDHTEQLQDQQRTITELSQALTDMQVREQAFVDDLTQRGDLINSLEANKDRLRVVIDDLKSALQSRALAFEARQAHVERLEQAAAASASGLERLAKQVAQADEQRAASQKKTADLSTQLAQKIQELTALETQHADLDTSYRRALDEREGARQREEQLNDSLEACRARITALERALSQETDKTSQLESSLRVWQAKIPNLEKKLQQRERAVQALQAELAAARDALPPLEKLLRTRELELEAERVRFHSSQTKLAALAGQIEDHAERLAAERAAGERLNQQRQRERTEFAGRIEKLQTESAANIEQLNSERAATSEQLEDVRSQLTVSNRLIAALKTKIAQLESLVDTSGRSAAADTRARDDAIAALDRAREEAAEWQRRHDELAALMAATSNERGATASASGGTAAKPADGRPVNLLAKRPADADDLKRIKGVGPKLEKLLNDLGIYRFAQIAEFDADDEAWVDNELGSFKGRIRRDKWRQQARRLAEQSP